MVGSRYNQAPELGRIKHDRSAVDHDAIRFLRYKLCGRLAVDGSNSVTTERPR
jgi:hypothetical protein